jgi:hypothetical protein
MLRIVLVFWFYYTSAFTVYNNAKFAPTDALLILYNNTQVNTQVNCACLCYNNSMCYTVTYSSINQQCTAYMAQLGQGTVYVSTTNLLTSVLTFANKTVGK